MKNEMFSEGSFLSFRIADESFAVNVNQILHIQDMCHITHVPLAPECVLGIINLRGNALPVIDLRKKINAKLFPFTLNTTIIVFEFIIDSIKSYLGAVVDQVDDVIQISKSQILPTPDFGLETNKSYIIGFFHHHEKIIMTMDIFKVFEDLMNIESI